MSGSRTSEDLKDLVNRGKLFRAGITIKALKQHLCLENYRDYKEVKELFQDIAEICRSRDSRFFTKVCQGTTIFRARVVRGIGNALIQDQGITINDMNTTGFDELNSREAPLGITEPGRNNVKGGSYFYAASNPATACAELKENGRQTISVAEFITRKDIEVVDLEKVKTFSEDEIEKSKYALGKYWGDLMFMFQVPIHDDSDYRITQIIAEEFRKQGVEGIVYGSFYGDGKNYTLFNCGTNILSFENSRLIQQMYTNQIYWDYNNHCCLMSFSDTEYYQFDEASARAQLNNIKQSWNGPIVFLNDEGKKND